MVVSLHVPWRYKAQVHHSVLAKHKVLMGYMPTRRLGKLQHMEILLLC